MPPKSLRNVKKVIQLTMKYSNPHWLNFCCQIISIISLILVNKYLSVFPLGSVHFLLKHSCKLGLRLYLQSHFLQNKFKLILKTKTGGKKIQDQFLPDFTDKQPCTSLDKATRLHFSCQTPKRGKSAVIFRCTHSRIRKTIWNRNSNGNIWMLEFQAVDSAITD